jgi:glutamate---cysteine ligase / carboxylate-amine ligase
LIEHVFGATSPLSVGVEEEIMILDGESYDPVGAVEVFVRESADIVLPGTLKTELHASVVELNTKVCADAAEAAGALAELRRAADAIARRNALRIAAGGSHPMTPPEELPIVQEPRYLEMVSHVGPTARRQGVSGLHVHVGVESPEACFHALEGILQWLPLVLALSVNSPYLGGVETGLLSNRAAILAELPRSGAPPAFRSYEDWERWVERLVRLGVTADYTRLWWDVRPHPRFGTLEVRMPDQPTTLARTAAFVGLLRALVAAALDEPQPAYDPGRRGDYQQNRWAALRFGMDAELIHPREERALPARELATELFEWVGSDGLDGEEPEAARQLEVGRAEGVQAVCADLVARTVA